MQIDIRADVLKVSRFLDAAQQKHIPFATAYAMTLTAKDVREEEVTVMRRVFDRPTPYTLNALQVKPATKSRLIAKVEFKEGWRGTPAKRFLNPNVYGGARSQKSHEVQIAPLLQGYSYLVPGAGAKLNGYGNITGGAIRRIISQLKVSRNADSNASNSARSRGKRKAAAYFVSPKGNAILERRGKTVTPVLVGVTSPNYTKRFPFQETAASVVASRLPVNFEVAFQRAMATAR